MMTKTTEIAELIHNRVLAAQEIDIDSTSGLVTTAQDGSASFTMDKTIDRAAGPGERRRQPVAYITYTVTVTASVEFVSE